MKMDWNKLFNSQRLGSRPKKTETGRSPFNSDHDKVIFSGAFRRLARKTQVHPLATNDHVHNRLTHSLEVATVGRTLAIRVGEHLAEKQSLPPDIAPTDLGDIVQTACLAHDIGNPPFGHTGEEAIRHWFKDGNGAKYLESLTPIQKCDLQHFEGNAQGFRVLTTSEYHPYEGGLRLTYASLASFIKYPWTSEAAANGTRPKSGKYGIYKSENDIFHEVAKSVGLLRKGDDWYCRHPLVHLMEIADDFCYAILDLEDGLEMGILEWEEVFGLLAPVLDQSKIEDLKIDLHKVRVGRRPPLMRGKVISAFVEDAARAFVKNEDKILAGDVDELLPLCSEHIHKCVKGAKDLAKSKIFSHPRKIELEIGAYNTISTLLDVMCEAAIAYADDNVKSYRSTRVLDLIGMDTFDPKIKTTKLNSEANYLALMRVMDFVSGMTDNYATHLSMQFSGMGSVR